MLLTIVFNAINLLPYSQNCEHVFYDLIIGKACAPELRDIWGQIPRNLATVLLKLDGPMGNGKTCTRWGFLDSARTLAKFL